MAESPTCLTPQTLARLEGLELRARRLVEGLVAGMHRSSRHGLSTEFAEYREYAPGDDPRHLDWRVFGRTERFYLKQHEDETSLACYLVLDASESMRYRGPEAVLSKFEYAQLLAAGLAYVITQQRDAVGLAVVDATIRKWESAASLPSQWWRLTRLMDAVEPSGTTDLGQTLHGLADRVRKRSLIVILSDLFDDVSAMRLGLRNLHFCRHDVSLLQVVDPAEHSFPFQQMARFTGLEDNETLLADASVLRSAYLAEFDEFRKQMRHICHDLNFQVELVSTDTPLDQALAQFLRSRMQRVALA